MGDSGCGKSTLMRHMVGLQRADGRATSLLGRGLLGGATSRAASALSTASACSTRAPPCGASMTLEENVALPLVEHAALLRPRPVRSPA